MNLNLEDEGDGKKKKRKRRPVQGGGGESDEADSKNLKKLGKFQEGGGESDEADSSSDSKNLKKLGKSQEGGGESDEADSKIWKKLGKKISKCLTEASDSLQVLKDYNEALKTTNPGAEEVIKDIANQGQVVSEVLERLLWKLLEEKAKMSEIIFSWRTSAPEIIPEPYYQEANECWTIALQRVHYSLMKKNGLSSDLSAEDIFNGVDEKYTNGNGKAIKKLHFAIPFMETQKTKMTVYRRPKLVADAKLHQEFETFIEKQFLVSPVVITLDCLPSFMSWCNEGANGLYVPADEELSARAYEKFERHCLYLSGHGKEAGGVRFFEVQDSFGEERGDHGFIRVPRDLCLIRELVVLELKD